MSPDRDRILEQALTHQLRTTTSQAAEGCLDAETLAAWSDGALEAAQVTLAEAHVSSCARCQALVGAMGRAFDADGTLRTPRTIRTGFWRWWFAPIAASAAAVMLWMVVPDQQDIATPPPQASARADAPVPAAPPAPVQPPREEKKEAAAQLREEPPVAAARDAAVEAPRPAAASPVIAGLRREARLAFVPLEIVSPLPQQRWRVTPAGIEHSEDGGATWTMVRQASGEAMVAGSSPAPTICWLVGQAGVVLVTADGRNFVRVEVPGRDDLVAVTATDARTATVTTASGLTLRTQDGGASWR